MAVHLYTIIICVCLNSCFGDQVVDNSQENILLRLSALENTVNEQRMHLAKRDMEIQTLKSTVNKQDEKMAALQKFVTDNVVQSNTDLNRSSRLLLDTEATIAFHARIDKLEVSHVADKSVLVFEVTALDIGGGYDNTTGIFTAPEYGLYMFSLSVAIIHPQNDIHAEIIHNNVAIAGTYAYGYDQGSVTVLTQMAAGDQVWVSSVNHPDTYLYGGTLTSFVGCRLV